MSRPALILLVASTACGTDRLTTESGSPSATLDPSCDDGAPVDTYVAGLSRDTATGAFTVTLTDAVPSPPDVGLNAFTLEVTSGGSPAPGTSLVLRPWMPLHGHGTTPETFTATEAGGAWTLDGVDLFMPGLWQLVFTADDGVTSDELQFRLCLEG